ncbi:MAG: LytTR family transcriptional regulator [bacterium]|nr:LytTR family transcriptional regulator [bacterium]
MLPPVGRIDLIIVRMAAIREIQPWFHGDYHVILRNGEKLSWSRRYRARIKDEPRMKSELWTRADSRGRFGRMATIRNQPFRPVLTAGAVRKGPGAAGMFFAVVMP